MRKAKRGKYVYCVAPSNGEKRSYGNLGMDGEEVYTISYKQVAAVVSDAKVKEYEPNPENARKHDQVIRKVMEDCTVLPMALGMVFKDKRTMLLVIRASYRAIKKSLDAFQNKVELGVKIIVPQDQTDHADDHSFQKAKSDILSSLSELACKTKEGRLFSDRLLLNASFLVQRDETEAFSKTLGDLDDKYRSLEAKYSGPWAPYNFVNIKIAGQGPGGRH